MTEADVLRYMRETRKTCCSLGPINVSKLTEAYESAAPAVGAIISSSLFRQVLTFGIINALYPATRWILAVLVF